MTFDRARSMYGSWRVVAALGILAVALAALVSTGRADSSKYDDPYWCSDWYMTHPDNSLSPDKHRRCLIAIASTYIDGEQNSIGPDDILFADNVVRYTIGHAPRPGSRNAQEIRDGIRAGTTAVILKIINRQWTVDLTNNQAFVIYDGYLKSDPVNPGFFVAERISIENGLITEIAIGGVQFGCGAPAPCP